MQKKNRLWWFLGVFLLLGGALVCILSGALFKRMFRQSENLYSQQNTASIAIKDTSAVKADSLSIVAVGDVMFGSNFPNASGLPPEGGTELMKEFTPYFQNADVVFANLEGVFLDSGGTPKGKGTNVYCFRQPVEMAKIYQKYGFNLLSIANNHMADFGSIGIASTEKTLRDLPIAFAGSKDQPTTQLIVNGKKIGLAAFAPHNGCQDMNQYAEAEALVKKLKAENDFVMVSFHGGAEGEKHQRVTRKREIFYGQNRGNVYEFAHLMIDSGADVVIGHGPHVLRAVEIYKNKFIAYSLGNFCTYGQFNLKGNNGLAALFRISLKPNGDFFKAKVISGQQIGKGGPILDPEKKAFAKIKELTHLDFPETGLEFQNDEILPKP